VRACVCACTNLPYNCPGLLTIRLALTLLELNVKQLP